MGAALGSSHSLNDASAGRFRRARGPAQREPVHRSGSCADDPTCEEAPLRANPIFPSAGLRAVLSAVAVVALLAGCARAGAQEPRAGTTAETLQSGARSPDLEERIAAGRYLARAGNCMTCHTVPGGEAYVGGRAFETPYGTIYSTNITPHETTGIGAWSDQDFLDAMQSGSAPDGHLYPALPYPWFANVSDADLLAIKDFLFGLPPVDHTAPENDLPFPFDQRWLLRAWDVLVEEQRFEPDPARSQAWNRGAYLVTGLGHCGACHTPRTLAATPNRSEAFRGEITEGWYAPNLTNGPAGLGDWTGAQIVRYLRHGHVPGKGSAVGPMHEVVGNSTSYLSDPDLAAMATYLKSLPERDNAIEAEAGTRPPVAELATLRAEPYEEPRGGAAEDDSAEAAARLYYGACASCHGPDGQGVKFAFPVLAGNSAVTAPVANNAIRVILDGIHTPEAGTRMPAFGPVLGDAEVAGLANYLIDRWGAGGPDVSADDVADLRGRSQRARGDETSARVSE